MVEIVDVGDRILVLSQYHPDFATQSQAIGGQYQWLSRPDGGAASGWVFPQAMRKRVEQMLLDVYGEDGTHPAPRVRVRVARDIFPAQESFWYFGGREVAYRAHTDAPVHASAGVAVVAGHFEPTGGSEDYPAVTASDDLMLEIADVPLTLAERARRERPGLVEILDEPEVGADANAKRKAMRTAMMSKIARLRSELVELERLLRKEE